MADWLTSLNKIATCERIARSGCPSPWFTFAPKTLLFFSGARKVERHIQIAWTPFFVLKWNMSVHHVYLNVSLLYWGRWVCQLLTSFKNFFLRSLCQAFFGSVQACSRSLLLLSFLSLTKPSTHLITHIIASRIYPKTLTWWLGLQIL